jgi:hypothetical protein
MFGFILADMGNDNRCHCKRKTDACMKDPNALIWLRYRKVNSNFANHKYSQPEKFVNNQRIISHCDECLVWQKSNLGPTQIYEYYDETPMAKTQKGLFQLEHRLTRSVALSTLINRDDDGGYRGRGGRRSRVSSTGVLVELMGNKKKSDLVVFDCVT